MAEVSDIRPWARDPNMCEVVVGRKVAARLGWDDVARLRLRAGMTWTARVKAEVEKAAGARQAYKAALGLLSDRGYSRAEMRERLVRRKFSEEAAEETVDRLVREGWVDDRAYARDVAEGVVRKGPASRRLIKARLRARTIEEELAETAAEASAGGRSELANAIKAVKQHRARAGRAKGAALQRKIAGALARRGFEDEVIVEAMEQCGLGSAFSNDG